MEKEIVKDLKKSFPTIKNVSQVSGFYDEIDSRKPYIIRGHLQASRAFEKWDFNFFKEYYGNIVHRVSRTYNRTLIIDLKLSDFINQHIFNTADEEDPYYMRSWQFTGYARELVDDLNFQTPANWLFDLPDKIFPETEFRLIFMGGKGTTFRLHYDTMMLSSFSCLTRGKKLWIFFEHGEKEKLNYGMFNAFKPNEAGIDLEKLHPYFVVQNESDLVFTPAGWWHQVINLEPSISYTENIVNQDNINQIIPYLKTDECLSYSNFSEELATFWSDVFSKLKIIKAHAEY